MPNTLHQSTVVLLGVGHTNAHVLRMWQMNPIRHAKLICISDFGVATYSGMLPGVLAGLHPPEQMQIDLVRLCAAAGARLILDGVTGHDVQSKQLHFADRPPLRYDVLSIGVGSRPHLPNDKGQIGIAIKPMQTFLDRLDRRMDILVARDGDRTVRIAVAGGGAGGFEIATGLPARIANRHRPVKFKVTLIDRNEELFPSQSPRARMLALEALCDRGVEVVTGKEVQRTSSDGRLHFRDGSDLQADLAIWATSAGAPRLLTMLGLETDQRGFVLTRNTLQTITSDDVFAVGDTGVVAQEPRPKAGVFAVRQGPVLWHNLQQQLAGQPLQRWRPQTSFLSLLSTGDRQAIFSYKGFVTRAAWCWKLKNWIDSRFVEKYQNPSLAMAPGMMTDASGQDDDQVMNCGGCGCKLPSDVLRRSLGHFEHLDSSQVKIGLQEPDDVAVIRTTPDHDTVASTDFFSAFIDDPFLFGRIAALNALSDLFAKNATPLGALAMVTVPRGPQHQQESLLSELLAGSLHEFCRANVSLVGGHTTQGVELMAGFTIIGQIGRQQITSKGGLQPDDFLVLTKPIGTGVLLAANSLARCKYSWMESLVESMLISNQSAGRQAMDLAATAVTDVTGFGLAGHLLEMLGASGVSAELFLDQVPVLPGVTELIGEGIESTLAPGNRVNEASMEVDVSCQGRPDFQALFDPQTSGGLLIGIPESKLATLRTRLLGSAFVIGRVVKQTGGASKIRVGTQPASREHDITNDAIVPRQH